MQQRKPLCSCSCSSDDPDLAKAIAASLADQGPTLPPPPPIQTGRGQHSGHHKPLDSPSGASTSSGISSPQTPLPPPPRSTTPPGHRPSRRLGTVPPSWTLPGMGPPPGLGGSRSPPGLGQRSTQTSCPTQPAWSMPQRNTAIMAAPSSSSQDRALQSQKGLGQLTSLTANADGCLLKAASASVVLS